MALLWMDSFDHYLTAHLASKYLIHAVFNNGQQAIAAVGRRGTNGLMLRHPSPQNNSSTGAIVRSVAPVGNTVIVGAGVRWVNGHMDYYREDSPMIFGASRLGTVQSWLRLNPSTALIEAVRGASSGTLLGSSSLQWVPNAHAFIEMKLVIAPGTAGAIEVRLNGQPILNLTGINTAQQGTAFFDTVKMGPIASFLNASTNMELHYDDLYILDTSGPPPWNDFLGDCRVDLRAITAEGALSDFTPLTGVDNALMVNQVTPDDDATYVSSLAAGATDTYVVQDMAVAGAGPTAIQLVAYGKKAAEGLAPLSGVVRIGGVNYSYPIAQNLGTSYQYRTIPIMTNPATGLPWTEAEFNAAEFGFTRG